MCNGGPCRARVHVQYMSVKDPVKACVMYSSNVASFERKSDKPLYKIMWYFAIQVFGN